MINSKDLILVDENKSGVNREAFFEYLNTRGFEFDWLQNVPNAKLIDVILFKRKDPAQRIVLIMHSENILRLCKECNKPDTDKFLKEKNIFLVHFDGDDECYNLCKMKKDDREHIQSLTVLSLNDGLAGDFLKQRYPNFTFTNLRNGHISHPIYHGELGETKLPRNKTFIGFWNAVGEHRKIRKKVYDSLKEKNLLANSLTKVHIKDSVQNNHDLAVTSNSYPESFFKNTFLSFQLPDLKSYEMTNYEIVCEVVNGGDRDDTLYFTEKTLKPIIMKHPFVMFGPKNYLKNLRSFGFKTFGDFIDESYDSYENCEDRIQSIVANVAKLNKDNGRSFYNATRDICQHNLDNLYYLKGKLKSTLWRKLNTVFERPVLNHNTEFFDSLDS